VQKSERSRALRVKEKKPYRYQRTCYVTYSCIGLGAATYGNCLQSAPFSLICSNPLFEFPVQWHRPKMGWFHNILIRQVFFYKYSICHTILRYALRIAAPGHLLSRYNNCRLNIGVYKRNTLPVGYGTAWGVKIIDSTNMQFSTSLELHSILPSTSLRAYGPLPASEISLSLHPMIPDYPHKHFSDKRNLYTLLMLTLAMDSVG